MFTAPHEGRSQGGFKGGAPSAGQESPAVREGDLVPTIVTAPSSGEGHAEIVFGGPVRLMPRPFELQEIGQTKASRLLLQHPAAHGATNDGSVNAGPSERRRLQDQGRLQRPSFVLVLELRGGHHHGLRRLEVGSDLGSDREVADEDPLRARGGKTSERALRGRGRVMRIEANTHGVAVLHHDRHPGLTLLVWTQGLDGPSDRVDPHVQPRHLREGHGSVPGYGSKTLYGQRICAWFRLKTRILIGVLAGLKGDFDELRLRFLSPEHRCSEPEFAPLYRQAGFI